MSSTRLIALLLLALVHQSAGKRAARRAAPDGMPSFPSFLATRGRTYSNGSAEYEERRTLYEERIAEAEKHNSQPHRRWTAGISNLWDRTEGELSALRGWNGGASSQRTSQTGSRASAGHPSVYLNQAHRAEALPQEVRWTHLNAVNAEIDQGSCGSCWAVAAAVILQAHSEIYTPTNSRTFSIQELVSCVPNPKQCGGTGGCEGATVELALNYTLQHGLANQNDAPYSGTDSQCTAMAANSEMSTSLRQRRGSEQGGIAFGMHSWEKLPENKYEPLRRALVEYGPVGVSVAANEWLSYSTGVFDRCAKDSVINHAVTLIGYGAEKKLGDKWWMIKNSWGPDWGEGGTIRLLRRDDDETAYCGIDKQPEQGSGCKNGPKEITVCGMCGILYDTAVPHFVGDGSAAKKLSLLVA